MAYLIVLTLILIGIAVLVASMVWSERKTRRNAVGTGAGGMNSWRDSRLMTGLRREVDWREGLTQLFLWSVIIAVVGAGIRYGPGAYESGSAWVLELPERFAVHRVMDANVAVQEERNRLILDENAIYPKPGSERYQRLHDNLNNGCAKLILSERTTCLTIIELRRRGDELDVLSQRLSLILFGQNAEAAKLPSRAEPFVPSWWRILYKTVRPDDDDKYLVSFVRVQRVFRARSGRIRHSDFIKNCAPSGTPDCVVELEKKARELGVQIIDDTTP